VIHKGRSLTVDVLSENASYFCRRVDGLKFSALASVPLTISDTTQTIINASDTVNLARESGWMDFRAERIGGLSYRWTLADSLQFSGEQIRLLFVREGSYSLQLESWDEQGCYASTEKIISVLNDFFLSSANRSKAYINLFPNPSSGAIRFESNIPLQIHRIHLLDSKGKLIQSFRSIPNAQLDLGGYPNGMYFLKFESEFGVETHKMILKK
jgi:hypothetical protein